MSRSRPTLVRALEKWTKRSALASLGIVARFLARPSGSGPIRSVLVIRVDERVGNVLLTSPLLVRLKDALPGARVAWLVARSKVSLAEGLAEVIPFEKKDLFRRPIELMRVLWSLRASRFDVAIDASHWHTFSASSALLLAWTGAPIRIAHDRGPAGSFASYLVPVETIRDEVAVKLSLLSPIGIDTSPIPIRTDLGRNGSERVDRFLEPLARGPLVAILPGSRKLDHRTDPSIFVELARRARSFDAVPIVAYGPGEESLANAIASDGGAVLAPSTNLEELAALLRRCSVAIANDTGPMHLAVATGVPTIALFVAEDHERWGHARAPHVVVPGHGRTKSEVLEHAARALEVALGRHPS